MRQALRDRAMICATFAFASDDEDKTQAGALGIQDKADQFGMRLGQGHAVQVDAVFRGKFATRHLAKCFGVHLQWRRGESLRQAGCDVVSGRDARLFAQPE